MSGHNKFSKIKHKKGAADLKRGKLFGKLLKAISIAAKNGNDPQFNPRLRSAIDQAKKENVPSDNIDRAINKSSEAKDLKEVVIEAYGPEGVAMIIEAITDNSNRTINEIRHILDKNDTKMANPGSVLWMFNAPSGEKAWEVKFPQNVSRETKDRLERIIEKIEEHEDTQKVTTNVI
ncbi:hypothetical protein GW950_00785 [Candidatus Wolfebacteria bacterium]|nr:hypothetical protein [Candidatus Wolfebacteria bacterium]